MDESTILDYPREVRNCNVIHRHKDNPKNVFKYKLTINCGGKYTELIDWQMYLCLYILNPIGRNAPIGRNIRVRDIIVGDYRYTALLRKSDSKLFLINLTTNKIRHVKYQFEGLITEKNEECSTGDEEERPKKKHKSSI